MIACRSIKVCKNLFSMFFASRENFKVGQRAYKFRCITPIYAVERLSFIDGC